MHKRLLILFFLSISPPLSAQNVLLDSNPLNSGQKLNSDIKPQDVIHWQAVQGQIFDDGIIILSIRLQTVDDFTLYENKVSFSSPVAGEPLQVTSPKTRAQFDPISQKTVDVFYGGTFEVAFHTTVAFQSGEFPLNIRYIGCTKVICLFPYTEKLTVAVYPQTGSLPLPFRDLSSPSQLDSPTAHLSQATLQQTGLEQSLADHLQEDTPWWIFLLIAFAGGMLTNITPCVYPMIPITMRILGQHSGRPIFGSMAYSLGIFTMYTALGTFAAWTGSFFGELTANPMVNLLFAAFMAVLGLSMLGFFDLSRFQRVGAQVGTQTKGLLGTYLMGTAAGLVAAPCTGPILATLMTFAASQGDFGQAAMMMSAYSFGFALPYVALGQTAAFFAGLKPSPSIQTAIKTAFAGVMFGLAYYYLRIPLYQWLTLGDGWWTHISLCTAGAVVVTMITITRLKNWQHRPRILLAPALMLGASIFAGSQAIIDSATTSARTELSWHHNLDLLLDSAKAEKVPILIDMWAEWCEACKKMEATTFSDPEVIRYLNNEKWHLGKLDLTESNDATEHIQEIFRIRSLPTLVIIRDPSKPDQFEHINGFVDAPTLLKRLNEPERN